MRITTCLASFLLASTFAIGQTYFYVNSIVVVPANPTTQDDINIQLIGDLATTGTYVVNASASMVGGNITLTVNCAQNIGLDVLVPHTETIHIGMQQAGTWTIDLNGNGMGDFASLAQHSFIVTAGAGSACDSVIIDHVWWSAFSDTALEVHVFNNSIECFDYPGFVLLQGADTLAIQNVDFFCVPHEASHMLVPHPGATMPTGPFTGELHLWTGYYSDLACTFEISMEDLCPPPPCVSVQPFINNYGDALVNASFDWTITTSGNVVVQTGTFYVNGSVQNDNDTTCLPPGNYNLTVAHNGVIGGQMNFGMSMGYNYGPSTGAMFLLGDEPDTLPFTFYEHCIAGSNGITERPSAAGIMAQTEGGQLMVRVGDGSIMGSYTLLDAMGKVLRTGTITGSAGSIPIDALAGGVYLFSSERYGVVRFVR